MTDDQILLIIALSSIAIALVIMHLLCSVWARQQAKREDERIYQQQLIESGITRRILTPEEIARRYG